MRLGKTVVASLVCGLFVFATVTLMQEVFPVGPWLFAGMAISVAAGIVIALFWINR